MHRAIFLASMLDCEETPVAQVPELAAVYFDGQSAQAQAVTLRIHQSKLQVCIGPTTLEVPLSQVQWSERTRHGRRSAELPGNALLQCDDTLAWDSWRQANGFADTTIVLMQQSWRWVSGLVLGLVVLLFSVYQWGLPALAKGVLQITPYVIDERIGALALAQLEAGFVQASELAPAQQETIRQAFGQALSAQDPTDLPPWRLEFRKCAIGPNAFALPGGTLVMTDDMVELVEGDTRVLVAVLGHELGHLRHRHGMRMLVQASALGTIASVLWGDFSWVLATVPTWLAQADYSRQAEREADAYALDVLNAAGISPSAMLTLFNKLKAKREADSVPTREAGTQEDGRDVDRWLGIAFSTHPEDAERIAFFQAGLRK